MVEINIRNTNLVVNSTAAAQVSPPLILGQRQAITLVNTSAGGQVITLQWGAQPATTGAGIVLYPSGSWSESLDSAFIPSNADIWAIASADAATLAIQERIQTK